MSSHLVGPIMNSDELGTRIALYQLGWSCHDNAQSGLSGVSATSANTAEIIPAARPLEVSMNAASRPVVNEESSKHDDGPLGSWVLL